MNWRTTIVLAVLAAGSFLAWVVIQPSSEVAEARERPFEWRESTYQTITIRVPEKPDIVLRRHPGPVLGSLWHMEKPAKPVDDTRVAEMIAALRRLSRDLPIKPGDPEHTPSTYGLDKPVAIVEVVAGGDRRTVKFGNASTRQPDYRFFMIEGEPEIFRGPADTAPPFLRSIADLRSRTILSYDPGRVQSVEVSRKYLTPDIGPDGKPVKGPDGKPLQKAAYEKLRFFFREKDDAGLKGWYLTSVNGEDWNEHAEDVKVGHLIAGLKELKAEEYVDLQNPGDYGFNEPETIVRLDVLQPPSSDTQATMVEIGRTEEKGARKVTYVRVDGAPEAAVVSAPIVDRLPRERKQFVSLNFIDFDPRLLESVEMLTDTGHKVKLVRTVNEAARTETWNVIEPAGTPVEPNSVNDFISWLVRVTISDLLGVQPDLKAFGLDKPSLVLTLRIKPKTGEPQDRVYKIGIPGDSKFAYLLKPGGKEVYQLSEEIWRRFDRTDLNFRQLTMFNTTNEAIVGMSFSYRPDHLSANPVRYAVRKVDGKWEFEGGSGGAKVDPDRMDQILGQLNYIRAESFITRNARAARDFDDPMGRLVIRYADPAKPGKAAEKAFRFSKSFADPSGRARFYYAKMEPAPGDTSPSSDATIIFRIKTEAIELLRQGVVYEAKADPGFRPGEPETPPPPPPPAPKGKRDP